MSTKSILSSPRAMRVGTITVSVHAMVNELNESRIAVGFTHQADWFEAGFHASADEARELAAQLIKHADAADKARKVEAA